LLLKFSRFSESKVKANAFICVRRRFSCGTGAFLLYYCNFVCYFIGGFVLVNAQIYGNKRKSGKKRVE